PVRYIALSSLVFALVVAGPFLVQWQWPVAIDSAPWLFTWALAIAVQAVAETRRRLRFRALFDAESGLPNRSVLESSLGSAQDSPVLVVGAIERFEFIRDGIGLAATNETIRVAAEKISEIVGGPVYRIAPDILGWTQ